jgi:adenine specific DNA methylase Mod
MQTEVVRACKSRFDEQLSRVYTRAVYNEYKRKYINSTAFVIEPDPEVECGYLVKHEKGDGTFCWAQQHSRWWLTKQQACINANACSGSIQVR